MKNIGKPCTGKPYARFDEGGLAMRLPSTLPIFRDIMGWRMLFFACHGYGGCILGERGSFGDRP